MPQRADDGFSLVEVILAMVLLGVLSLAVLPLLISVTVLSVSNRATVSATAFAESQLAAFRDAFPNNPAATGQCTDAQAFLPVVPAPSGLTATIDVTCSTAPGTHVATIEARVFDAPSGGTTTVTTQILVVNP